MSDATVRQPTPVQTGHWRARYRVSYADAGRLACTYEAWIGADDEAQARELLAKDLTDPDIGAWELLELVDATSGDPCVIATWTF